MTLKGKQQAYAEARGNGMDPQTAGSHAGYAGSSLRVQVSKLENSPAVQAEIRRIKRGGKSRLEAEDDDDVVPERKQWKMKPKYRDPLSLMLNVMNNKDAPTSLRYQAAKDALPYCHARKEGGKKDEALNKAKEIAEGKGKPRARQPMARPSHVRAH